MRQREMGKRRRADDDEADLKCATDQIGGSQPSDSKKQSLSEKKRKKKKKNQATDSNLNGIANDKLPDDANAAADAAEGTPARENGVDDKALKKKKKKDRDSTGKKKRKAAANIIGSELEAKGTDEADALRSGAPKEDLASPGLEDSEHLNESSTKRSKKKGSKERLKESKKASIDDGEVGDRKTALTKSKRTKNSDDGNENTEGLQIPTVSEVVERTLKKRDVFLHGYAAKALPSAEQLTHLSDEAKHEMIGNTADQCERTMTLLHDTIVAVNRWTDADQKDDLTAIEETLANDLIRLKKMPIAKQYVEITLWKRSLQLIRDQLQAASKLGFGKGLPVKEKAHGGLLLHRDDDPDAEFVSYREAYMKGVVDRYSESLDKMRTAENMDADRVKFLLRCLESGANLFANLKCREMEQSKDEKSKRKPKS